MYCNLFSTVTSKTARSRCRWSVSGGRACGTVCECHELVDGASERLVSARDCSAARFSAAIAAQIVLQQAVWPHKQLDMPCLLLGQSRPDGQLVKVFLASLVRIVHDGTSQLVVAPAQCVVSMLVPLDMLLW